MSTGPPTQPVNPRGSAGADQVRRLHAAQQFWQCLAGRRLIPGCLTGVRAALIPGRARNIGLALPDGVRVAGQDAVELAAGADAELGEDFAQVVLDRAGTDE
jgi:hypothetical protein